MYLPYTGCQISTTYCCMAPHTLFNSDRLISCIYQMQLIILSNSYRGLNELAYIKQDEHNQYYSDIILDKFHQKILS